MTDSVKVQDVKVEAFNQHVDDTILVDTSNNRGLNIYNTKVYVNGSKTFDETNPILNGSGQLIQFNIPTNGQTLSTTNSKLVYTVKLVMKCAKDRIGKFVMTSMGWWYIPCEVYTMVLGDGTNDTEGTRVIELPEYAEYICGTTGGSYGIIDKSQLQYGSINQTDELLHIRNNIIQSQMTQEYINAQNTTFFDTTNRIIEIENIPYQSSPDSYNGDKIYQSCRYFKETGKVKLGDYIGDNGSWQDLNSVWSDADKTSKYSKNAGENVEYYENYYQHTIYKQFTVPLALVNQIFDADENVFYMQALNQNSVKLTIQLLPYYMAEIFGNAALLDHQKTGISDFYLSLYSSQSEDIQGLIMEKDKYCSPYLRYVQQTQMVNRPEQKVNLELVNGFTSLSSVYFCLYRQDQGQSQKDELSDYETIPSESNYVHGRITLFTPAQLWAIYNGIYDSQETFVFFHDLQINRGSTTYKLFSEPLTSIEDMMNETKRSFNFNNNKTEGMLESCHSYLKRLMKYAYINTTFDSSSLVYGPTGVVYDGYDSMQNKINYSYYLSYYNFANGMNNQVIYNAQNVPNKCKIADSNYNLLAIQNYDQTLITNTKNHNMSVQEKPVVQLTK